MIFKISLNAYKQRNRLDLWSFQKISVERFCCLEFVRIMSFILDKAMPLKVLRFYVENSNSFTHKSCENFSRQSWLIHCRLKNIFQLR